MKCTVSATHVGIKRALFLNYGGCELDLADKLVSWVYSERAGVSLLNFNGDADSVEGGELCDSAARKVLRVA